jgi:O-antigen/teichoic acid export membrane protein
MFNFFAKIYNNIGNESQRSLSVKKQVSLSFGIKIISVIIGVLLVPLLIDYLDNERYGVWLTLSSVFAWFSFFDIGIGNGMRNKLAEALAVDDKLLAREYVSTTYAVISCVFVSIIILFQLINPFIDWRYLLNVKIISENELYVLTTVVFTIFLIRFIFQLTGVVYIAVHKPSINNAITTVGAGLSFIIILLLFKLTDDGSLFVLGVVLTGAPLIMLLGATLFAFSGEFRFLRPKLSFVKSAHIKSLLNLGLKFFVIQIAAILLFSSANIIISQLFTSSEVVVYNTALMYYQLPIMVYAIVMTPIWSAVTDAYAKNDFEWLKMTLKRLNKLSVIFAVGIIGMLAISPLVFKLWIGDRMEIPFLLSASMACFSIINVFLSPYTNFINGIGKMKFSMYLVIFTLFCYIPLAIFLSRIIGNSSGIIITTCLINATGLYFQPYQVNKLLNKKANGVWNK